MATSLTKRKREDPVEVQTTQLFSRRAVGFLWSRRGQLDPGQVEILNALYSNKKKGSLQGEQTITYKLSSTAAGKLGYGRIYGSKGSLETLEKECRGTICKDLYHDVDIANCHPVLLAQLAKQQYDRDLPELDKYVDNRDAFLASISSNRDEAKTEVIRVLYGRRSTAESTSFPFLHPCPPRFAHFPSFSARATSTRSSFPPASPRTTCTAPS